MIAAISPSAQHFQETMSTLKYVERAKKIVNKAGSCWACSTLENVCLYLGAVVNESSNENMVRQLQAEIASLRQQLAAQHHAAAAKDDAASTIEYLTSELLEREQLINSLRKTWEQKLSDAHFLLQEQSLLLEQLGLSAANASSNETARLILLSPDEDEGKSAVSYVYAVVLKQRTALCTNCVCFGDVTGTTKSRWETFKYWKEMRVC